MPRGAWTAAEERQYKAVLTSELRLGRSEVVAKSIAAATVNAYRTTHGETKAHRKELHHHRH